jgi:hypothetical protein
MEKLQKMREDVYRLIRLKSEIESILYELEDSILTIHSEENYESMLDDVYVVYNVESDFVFEFANKRDVILYGSVEEAMQDNEGVMSSLSRVMKACDIPKKWRDKIIHQLKHN